MKCCSQKAEQNSWPAKNHSESEKEMAEARGNFTTSIHIPVINSQLRQDAESKTLKAWNPEVLKLPTIWRKVVVLFNIVEV